VGLKVDFRVFGIRSRLLHFGQTCPCISSVPAITAMTSDAAARTFSLGSFSAAFNVSIASGPPKSARLRMARARVSSSVFLNDPSSDFRSAFPPRRPINFAAISRTERSLSSRHFVSAGMGNWRIPLSARTAASTMYLSLLRKSPTRGSTALGSIFFARYLPAWSRIKGSGSLRTSIMMAVTLGSENRLKASTTFFCTS